MSKYSIANTTKEQRAKFIADALAINALGAELLTKNQDLYKENQKLLKDNAFQSRRAQEWQNKALEYDGENDRLERENRSLREDLSLSEEFQNSAVGLYHTARKHFPGFEKGFNQLKDKFLNDHKFERIGQFMDVAQDNVYKVDRKREKRRTDDLEM